MPILFLSSSTPADFSTTFATAVNGANAQVMTYVGVGAGAAIGIVIALWAIKKGITFFKSLANKAG